MLEAASPPPDMATSETNLTKQLPNIININDRSLISIIETRARIFVICAVLNQIPFLVNWILMNIFHFLKKKFFSVDILRLNILPKTMFLVPVAPLHVEKFEQIFPVVFSKLVQDLVSGE